MHLAWLLDEMHRNHLLPLYYMYKHLIWGFICNGLVGNIIWGIFVFYFIFTDNVRQFFPLIPVYFILYNDLSYSHIFIGSHLWSIIGETQNWCHHYKVWSEFFSFDTMLWLVNFLLVLRQEANFMMPMVLYLSHWNFGDRESLCPSFPQVTWRDALDQFFCRQCYT